MWCFCVLKMFSPKSLMLNIPLKNEIEMDVLNRKEDGRRVNMIYF